MKSQLLATFTTKDNLNETIEKITPAPSKFKLKMFGGCLSIEEYRELFNENDIEYDYLNFVDPKYFETPNKNQEKLLLITAAYVEGIRLIDNMEVIQ